MNLFLFCVLHKQTEVAEGMSKSAPHVTGPMSREPLDGAGGQPRLNKRGQSVRRELGNAIESRNVAKSHRVAQQTHTVLKAIATMRQIGKVNRNIPYTRPILNVLSAVLCGWLIHLSPTIGAGLWPRPSLLRYALMSKET
jgi:hypothetical protein